VLVEPGGDNLAATCSPSVARRPAAAFLVPGVFVGMMPVGAAVGFAGTKLPLVEAVILTSVLALGGLIVAEVRMPPAVAMAVVRPFAVFPGHVHAIEAPAAGTGGYILGFMGALVLVANWSIVRSTGISRGHDAEGGDIQNNAFPLNWNRAAVPIERKPL